MVMETSMQASTQKAKGELIAEMKGKSHSWTIKEVGKNGMVMEMNDAGDVTGKYDARFMETVVVHTKPDGTMTWEGRGVQNSGQDMILVTGKGTARRTPTGNSWEGEMTFMTQSPKLAWLNNTKGWQEGTANMADQTFTARIYAKK
jgi:hypothetical protein